MSDSALFRGEALTHRLHKADGRPRLVTPPGSGLLCVLLVGTVAAALILLFAGDYARKAVVPGYIETSDATKRIYTPFPGTIDAVNVVPGQQVASGQPLVTLSSSAGMSRDSRERMLAEFDEQTADVEKRLSNLRAESQSRQQEIMGKMQGIRRSLSHTSKIMAIQAQKVSQLQETHDAVHSMFEAGHLSRLEWDRLTGALLDARQQQERLGADAGSQVDRLQELKIGLRKAAFEDTRRRIELEQESSRIAQSRQSFLASSPGVIHAAMAGIVANVFVQAGDTVSPARPVISIAPVDASLVAKLLIPSRSVGFVHVGQAVNLLYDAYPYQHFGSFGGHLARISNHVLAPGDATMELPVKEPFFEADATIDKPWIVIDGRKVPLRAGMSLRADILLDHHSLLAWLLEPLRGTVERTR